MRGPLPRGPRGRHAVPTPMGARTARRSGPRMRHVRRPPTHRLNLIPGECGCNGMAPAACGAVDAVLNRAATRGRARMHVPDLLGVCIFISVCTRCMQLSFKKAPGGQPRKLHTAVKHRRALCNFSTIGKSRCTYTKLGATKKHFNRPLLRMFSPRRMGHQPQLAHTFSCLTRAFPHNDWRNRAVIELKMFWPTIAGTTHPPHRPLLTGARCQHLGRGAGCPTAQP